MMTLSRRVAFVAGCLSAVAVARAGDVIGGADISSLPDIERDGGRFFDGDQAGDEIAILRRHGCELFRVRLFVDPDPDPKHNYGATQSLPYVRDLGQRIKAAGGRFLLDLHYSDTWADPIHQTRPKAWATDVGIDALERRVGDYTAAVMKDLQAAGAGPDMVQVGNEITAGMLWPEGRVIHGDTPQANESWQRLSRLLAAGANAVRASERGGRRIPVVLHVHGGGRAGLPQDFFRRLSAPGNPPIDYDVIGLSFYPAWDDSIDALRKNVGELVATHDKPVLLAEVGYPWTAAADVPMKKTMQWPRTPQGQADYLRAVRDLLAAVPNDRGLGYVWWYSDSIRVNSRPIWRDGSEALFDHDGRALPAVTVFKEKPATRSAR